MDTNSLKVNSIKVNVSVEGLEETTEKIKELVECIEKANSLIKELANSEDLSVTVKF